MPATLARVVRRCLNTLTVPISDADLLRSFHRHRDPAAFAELVARHGPVVLGVARRVMGRCSDVDDVFQATFLILARNAGSVRDPGRLPGWLHRVALRTARRSIARRRATLPMETAEGVGSPAEPCDLSWREGLQILDDELNALPDRLRSPLVLCYLDGLTRDEAAQRLGYSLAKLKRRLEEGRGRLRDRLVKRGVSAALLVAVAAGELRAAVPPGLAAVTSDLPFGRVPNSVALLAPASGTVVWKAALVLGLLGGVLVAGAQVPAGGQTPPKGPPAKEAPAPAKIAVDPNLEAPLPAGAIARLGSTRFRHNNGSNSSVLSMDGKILVTTGKTTIAVWDTTTGERKHLLRNCGIADGFTSASRRIALSPDNALLANFSESEVDVRVWDLATGKQLYGIGEHGSADAKKRFRLRQAGGADARENILTFNEAGTELLLVGANGAGRFEAKTGKPLGKFDWNAAALAVSANGRWCLTNAHQDNASGPRKFAVVELTDGKVGPAVESGEGKVSGNVALSADGKRFAVIETEVKLTMYDVATGKEVATFECPETGGRDRVFTIPAFSADGRTLFVGTAGGKIHRYDLGTKTELPPLAGHLWWVTGIHPLPDGKTLASAGWDGMVRKFDLTTGKEIPPPAGYTRTLSLAVSPDGSRIVVADMSGRLDVYDAAGEAVRALDLGGRAVHRVAFAPDGKTLAAVGRDGEIRTWDTATWRAAGGVPSTNPGKEDWLSVFQYTPDGRRLLVCLRESGLRCLDAPTLKEVWTAPVKGLSAAAASPDGRLLVTGGWDNHLTWRDPATGQPGRVVTTQNVVDTIDFAPDGRTFVSAGHDGSVRRWDAETGKPLGEWQGHGGAVWFARHSPDGKWVVSGAVDETVRVWETATGKELAKLPGHDNWVMEGRWLRGGRLVTVCSGEGLIWDLKPAAAAFAKPDALWDALADDVAGAYQAQWNFLADPKRAVEFVRTKLAPDKAPADEKRIQKLLADLDNDEFRIRERATKELRAFGRPILPYLRTGRAKANAEGDQRLGALIAELDLGPTPDERRRSRAVQVLELAGTPEARALLAEWAGGLRGSLLTEDAAAAVNRLRPR